MQKTALVNAFRCLAADCPDTCCKGWGMQVDKAHVELYRQQAPELLDAVTHGEAEHIMRRDTTTDYCVKYAGGLCSIHAQYGEQFLGDACHLYPRSTKRLGEHMTMTAAMSCPEVVRLHLTLEKPTEWQTDGEATRLPENLRDYTPEGMSAEDAWQIHESLLRYGDDPAITSRLWLVALHNVARSLRCQPPQNWAAATGFYLRSASQLRVEPVVDAMMPYRLLQLFTLLLRAGSASMKARLTPLRDKMALLLRVTLDEEDASLTLDGTPAHLQAALQARWTTLANAADVDAWLKRWVAGEIQCFMYPLGGLGQDVLERTQILAVKYALLRLALQAQIEPGKALSQDVVIDVMYQLARYLDHLSDATLLLSLIQDAGWNAEGAMNGLLLGG